MSKEEITEDQCAGEEELHYQLYRNERRGEISESRAPEGMVVQHL